MGKTELKRATNGNFYMTIRINKKSGSRVSIQVFEDCKSFLDVVNDKKLVGKAVKCTKVKRSSYFYSMGRSASLKYKNYRVKSTKKYSSSSKSNKKIKEK